MPIDRFADYQRLKIFAKSRPALLAAFIWGLAEATVFFIVPDVFFIFTALFAPLYGILHGIISMGGTLIGGCIMYKAAILWPEQIGHFLIKVPLVSQDLVSTVHNNLLNDGLKTMLSAPLKGIPYKIYAAQTAIIGIDFAGFMLFTVPARLERILLLAGIGAVAGRFFAGSIKNNTKKWLLNYLLAWAIFYVFYAYRMILKY